jgi:hypothetical protein
MAKDESSLKRLGGGRWQTRDERFTIEGDGGRWTVVDAERTDDLGLPLVRGPYASLTDAKAAIEHAREEPDKASPLAERIAAARAAPKPTPRSRAKAKDAEATGPATKTAPHEQDEGSTAPPPPTWLTKLAPDARTHAARLLEAVAELGLDDAEALVKRDVLDDEPAVAEAVLLRRLALVVRELAGKDADAAERQRVARIVGTTTEWLANRGREPGPRLALPGWRVVEDGATARRIAITRSDVERAVRDLAED